MLNQVLAVKRFAGYLAFAGAVASIFTPRAKAPAAPPKHGLTGDYYVSNWDKDVPPPAGPYAQVWRNPNDFSLPKIFTPPVASRVDAQVAFGQGKGFSAKNPGPPVIWWPAASALPAGWTDTKNVWNYFAAVIWKGYIHLPKAGTYYFATVSNGASAVYLNQARVALNGNFGGALVSDTFSYAKESVQDYDEKLNPAYKFTARPRDTYVIPVLIDAPRDLPIEVRYNPSAKFTHWANEPFGIDLFWVTPDSSRDDKGKPVAGIVPSDALYTEAPGPIEKPVVRGANSTISADFLYFPTQGAEGAVTLTIRLADKDGNPVSGKRVYVNSLNDWNADAIVQPDKPTDKSGEATAKIRANATNPYPHDSTIFATDLTDLMDVAQVAHVTFQQSGAFFFPDSFSPYYDPNIPLVEPLPLRMGRPVTIKAPLVNRNKFTAEVTVTFEQNAWNIGASGWSEIGSVKDVRLQQGEHKDVSITWTPEQTTGHICFRVNVTGHVIAATQGPGNNLVASLLPSAGFLAMAQGQQQPLNDSKQSNKGPVAPGTNDDCDPRRYDKETSEEQAGKDLLEASLRQEQEAHQELKDWAKEEGIGLTEVTAGKGVVLKLISKAMSAGGKVVLKAGVTVVGIVTTEEWLRTDVYPHIRDYNREMRTSGDMADAGARLLEESTENFKKGLDQAGRCQQQWAKQDENERLHEAAKRLRDSWELEGGRDLYKDPNDPNPYPMDAAQALKRAEEILAKSNHPMSAPARPRRPHVVLANVAQSETNVELTTEQLQAALREIDSALNMLAAGRGEMEKKQAFEQQLVAQVRVLLELLGAWEQDSAGAAAIADDPAYLTVAQGYAQNAVLSQLKSRADEAARRSQNTLDKDPHCDEKCRGEQVACISRLSQLSRALDSRGKHSMTLAQIPADSMFHRLAVADSDTSEGYLDAMSRSIARYRGAVAAADTEWMSRHLTAARLYWGRLAAALRREAVSYQREAEQIHAKQPQGVSETEAVMSETQQHVRQNVRFGPTELAALGALPTQEAESRAISTDASPVSNPGGAAESLRSLLLSIASVDKGFAEYESTIASAPLSFADPAKRRAALSQTYAVGNPHYKEENIDLFIRPISIPADWKLSITNAQEGQAEGHAAKPDPHPPQYPVREVDPGKHYAVTLPAKAQVKVASVLIPVGEVGANTTARWAVEGKIGNELIGGMVHEMNVPYIIADLQLPPVGSKEVEEELPAPSKPWARIITEVAAGIVILALFVFFFLVWRRRRGGTAAS